MPVHDAMHTHAQAQKLYNALSDYGDENLKDDLKEVQAKALKASSASADAAMAFFGVLSEAMRHEDAEVRILAHEIYHGPYNAEIA